MINCSRMGPSVFERHTSMTSFSQSEYNAQRISSSESSDDCEDHCDGPSTSQEYVGDSGGTGRECKPFTTFDTLRYERERLATFINWPLTFLTPQALAKAGFYYLRTADHTSCVFCRGIVGAWEEGDDPLVEHTRHFPTCPFMTNRAVGNVPILQGDVLSSLQFDETAEPAVVTTTVEEIQEPTSNVFAAVTAVTASKPLESVSVYTGPINKEFITAESRKKSFKNWPENVQVSINQLVEAGFFYLSLSDHVRCFHCGQGLRNWIEGDNPWAEHARWYPDCHFVRLNKGNEFIEKVRKSKPTLSHMPISRQSVAGKTCPRAVPSQAQMDCLMLLDIPQAVMSMGFTDPCVRTVMSEHIQETGVAFQTLEACMEKVMKYEDALKALNEPAQKQELKLAMHNDSMTTVEPVIVITEELGIDEVNTTRSPTISREPSLVLEVRVAEEPLPTEVHVAERLEIELLRENSLSPNTVESISQVSISASTPTPTDEIITVEVNESSHDSLLPVASSTNATSYAMIQQNHNQSTLNEASGSSVASGFDRISTASFEQNLAGLQRVEEIQLIKEKDQLSRAASNASAKSHKSTASHCRSMSSCSSISQEDLTVASDCECEPVECLAAKSRKQEVELRNLRATLEQMKESRTCKVCMDHEVAVVLLPCQHMVTCAACTLAVETCPFCRAPIVHAIRPNMA